MSDVRTLEEWDALFRDSQPRHLKLIFSDGTILENDRIVQESLLLEEALCSEENLRYGSCEAGCLRLRIVAEPLPPEQYIIDSDNNRIITDDGEIFMDGTDYSMTIDKSFEGLYVNVIMQFDEQSGVIVTDQGEHFVTSDGEEIAYTEIPAAHFGNYRVVSDTPTSDRVYRDLICYDKMYDILNANVVDWYNSLTFPISIKDMRDSFFEYLGVPQIETELINDDYEVNGKFKADYDMSGKSIIESICELNGVFGHITRYGEFEYISLPTQDSLEYPYYKNGTSKYEDYLTSNITQISLASDSDDSSIVVGTSGNTYYMQANPLTYEMDEDASLMYALNNLLDLISQFSYRPFETTTYGNPMLPIGTNVTFNTRYKPIESFVMARSLSGIQSLKDKFSAKGQRVYPKDTNNSANQLTRAKNTSSQQAQTIVLKVDENGNMVAVKLGESASRGSFFDLNADNIKFVANSTLNMKAAQLNIESDKVSITPEGRLNAVDASFTGRVDATTMLFWDALNMYSSYGQYEYNFVNMYWGGSDEVYTKIRAPYGASGEDAIYLMGPSQSAAYGGYRGILLGDWKVDGALDVAGAKPRVVDTKDYGTRKLYCYEMASPIFGDIGDGKIAEDGKCYVSLDPVFAQTISTDGYQVFLQKCGDGDCYIAERKPNYFIVQGTPGLTFCWELKAKQSDFSQRRLEPQKLYKNQSEPDYGEMGMNHIKKIQNEREVV